MFPQIPNSSVETFLVIMRTKAIPVAPLGVLIGWLHMKRTLAYPTDMAINVEANPYMYTVYPGKEKELWAPAWLLLLRTMRKVLEKEDVLSAEEKGEFENITTKIERLLKGEVIGVPRQRRLLARLEGRN